MLLNSLPNTADVTYGYFRKIIIIPFTQTFDKNEDKFLIEKLIKELPGILNWALKGLEELQKNQYVFSKCTAVNSLMNNYKEQQNPTGIFFNETYIPCESGRIKKSQIYSAYQVWCNENGLAYLNRQNFWNLLKIKAGELNCEIKLHYKRVHGIDYLDGYKRKYEHPAPSAEFNFSLN